MNTEPAATPPRRHLLLVTGMSGAGKSTALKALEDIGYEVVDNLPLSLLSNLVRPNGAGGAARGGASASRPLALCIDVRTRQFDLEHFEHDIAPLLDRPDLDVTLLFLDGDDEALRRRFTETRRPHPLAADRPVIDGIRRERERLNWLKSRADLTVNTTELSIVDLRRLLEGHFSHPAEPELSIFVVSFSYPRGLPADADLVFDVRFLSNPHYESNLRPLSGLDLAVGRHIEADSAFAPFFANLEDMLISLLPAYEREGKSYLTIAVGCTGGRHRSVFVAERVGEVLLRTGRQVGVRHRDLSGGQKQKETPGSAS
ncbi:MAG: RNase adapter RapZ [Rhodospirillaceae bacterium]|jgi:RNase adapter protein RapZ|nr:RNase adapter RapZ [Rhodospirillaceae bacterium]